MNSALLCNRCRKLTLIDNLIAIVPDKSKPPAEYICITCFNDAAALSKAGKKKSNAVYEYLYAKLVTGHCMDNDIATELRCMSDEEILAVIRRDRAIGHAGVPDGVRDLEERGI